MTAKYKTQFEAVATTTKKFVKCPACGEHEWQVDQLAVIASKASTGYSEMSWSCKGCYEKFELRYHVDGTVTIAQLEQTNPNPFVPSLVLLKSNTGGDKPIYAVVNTRSHLKSIQEAQEEVEGSSLQYFYDEGTCPTNWFRDIVELVQDSEVDPHGCFEFQYALKLDDAMEFLENHKDVYRSTRFVDEVKEEFIEIGQNIPLLFPSLFDSEGGHVFDGEVVGEVPLLGDPQNRKGFIIGSP